MKAAIFNKTTDVKDIGFVEKKFDRNTFVKWVGGRNGNGTPQLQRNVRGTQVAARAAFMEYYDVTIPSDISVISASVHGKDDVNPYHRVLRNSENEILDVSTMSYREGRKMIKTFVK